MDQSNKGPRWKTEHKNTVTNYFNRTFRESTNPNFHILKDPEVARAETGNPLTTQMPKKREGKAAAKAKAKQTKNAGDQSKNAGDQSKKVGSKQVPTQGKRSKAKSKSSRKRKRSSQPSTRRVTFVRADSVDLQQTISKCNVNTMTQSSRSTQANLYNQL